MERAYAKAVLPYGHTLKRYNFHYVFSNGDAHLKNFSLFESDFGDCILTPAYDLICTSLHFPDEARTALDLFDEFESESFRKNAFYKRPDFLKLAEFYGMDLGRAERFLDRLVEQRDNARELIRRSFLTERAKAGFCALMADRLKAIAD